MSASTEELELKEWITLREAVEEMEPHEHADGMNECLLCDEPLLLRAARLLRKLEEGRHDIKDIKDQHRQGAGCAHQVLNAPAVEK